MLGENNFSSDGRVFVGTYNLVTLELFFLLRKVIFTVIHKASYSIFLTRQWQMMSRLYCYNSSQPF